MSCGFTGFKNYSVDACVLHMYMYFVQLSRD